MPNLRTALSCLLALGLAGTAGATDSAWVVAAADDTTWFASTFDTINQSLVLYCRADSGECGWMHGSRSACTPGETYSGTVISDGKSRPISLHCAGSIKSGLHRLLLSGFSTMNDAVAAGDRIELRWPRQQHPAVFLLQGSHEAIQSLESIIGERATGDGT